MINEKIVQIFGEIADMLEILNENVFRVRAYRRATEAVRGLGDVEQMVQENPESLEKTPGIGKELHAKILEIMETGVCQMHQELQKKLPPGILDLLRLRGVGPKKVKLFYEQLGISTLEALRSAAESGALATLAGMGEKSQASILEALNESSYSKPRMDYEKALPLAEEIIAHMSLLEGIENIAYAGSLRRKQATVGDIDILVSFESHEHPEALNKIMDHFIGYKEVNQVLGRGDTKSSVVLKGNVQVDLRVVDSSSFGAALFYFTGPKQFNIHVRTLALKRGLKINEYGLYEGEKQLAGRTEEEMFEGLDLPYLSPEQRGEFK